MIGRRIAKLFVACATTAAMVLSMTACGKQDVVKNNEKVAITMWHYYSGAQKSAFDKMVDEFNETVGLDKGVSVTAVAMGSINDLNNALTNASEEKVGADEMPDMFVTYVDTAMQIDAQVPLAALDGYFTEKELSGYVGAYIDEGRFDATGKLKVFPVAKATEIMMINKTVWDEFSVEAGVNAADLATWEGLAMVSEKYYDWSGGKAFFGRDAMANYILSGSMELGHEIFSVENGKVTLDFDKATMRKLWDNYYVPYINGYYFKEGRFASDDLKVGSIMAYVGSTSSASYFPSKVYIGDDDIGTPIDCLVLPVPSFDGCDSVIVQQGAGYAVVKSDEASEKACAEFLKWFTQSERNTYFALSASYMPVKVEACSPEYVEQVATSYEMSLSQPVMDTLKVSIKSAAEDLLYTTQAFDNGYSARNVLEYSLKDKAAADKAEIDSLVAGGTTVSDAVAAFDTNDNFEKWYNDTLAQLKALLGE